MYQLLYKSVSSVECSPLILTNIVDVAVSNNALLGVTGLLVCAEDRFLQVLEGSRDSVLTIMRKIERDTRHHDIEILFQGDVPRRAFPEWSMAVAEDGGEPSLRLAARVGAAMRNTNAAVVDYFNDWIAAGSVEGRRN